MEMAAGPLRWLWESSARQVVSKKVMAVQDSKDKVTQHLTAQVRSQVAIRTAKILN